MSGGGGEAGHVSGEFRVYAEQMSASLADLAREVEALGSRVDAADRRLTVLVNLWVERTSDAGRLAEHAAGLERRTQRLEARANALARTLAGVLDRLDRLEGRPTAP